MPWIEPLEQSFFYLPEAPRFPHLFFFFSLLKYTKKANPPKKTKQKHQPWQDDPQKPADTSICAWPMRGVGCPPQGGSSLGLPTLGGRDCLSVQVPEISANYETPGV